MLDNAVELNVNVIGFNYRGVADSTGLACSSDDLIIDGIAQVQRLIDRGVDPEKIVLRGNSLGGAVAALVGQHFHKRDQKVSVFSARSFSTITNAIVAWIRTGYPEDRNETTYRKILGWLAKPFIMLAVAASKWEMDGYSAYQSIPDAYKEYMVVRSSRAKRVPARKDDTVIPHYASLHLALRPERRLVKQRLDFAKNEIQSLSEQCHIIKPDLSASLAKINDARLRLKERKMETAADEIEGHIVNLHELTNRYNGQAGHRFFQQFVSRVSDRSRNQLLSSFNRI
jgi:pimeloyl-ACP methyl ester carboxylesterase